jgi:hypothetical protein
MTPSQSPTLLGALLGSCTSLDEVLQKSASQIAGKDVLPIASVSRKTSETSLQLYSSTAVPRREGRGFTVARIKGAGDKPALSY